MSYCNGNASIICLKLSKFFAEAKFVPGWLAFHSRVDPSFVIDFPNERRADVMTSSTQDTFGSLVFYVVSSLLSDNIDGSGRKGE
jgi:hypothetical protein